MVNKKQLHSIKNLRILWIALFFSIIGLSLSWTKFPTIFAQAAAKCSTAYLIDETFPNGGRWQMCWEYRRLQGILLHDVYYTPPNGTPRKVFAQAGIGQIHVPYDDNGWRVHDVTDFGLGGENMAHLNASECVEGKLIRYFGKNVLCQQTVEQNYAYKYGDVQASAHAFNLFSVSQIDAYNYIVQWRFFEDGTIEPSIGATGELQRKGNNPNYGWPLNKWGTTGISHIHNYYWRLDFDIGDDQANDMVEELEFVPTGENGERLLTVSPLTAEAGRSLRPTRMRSWRIRDATMTNSDGHVISYQLDPVNAGHRHIGPSYEPWTFNDFYVTKEKTCEQFVSHNPQFGGCGDNLADFVNHELINGEDLVLWYGLTFHHLPRDEDEPYMSAHWDGFQLVPRDWTAQSPIAPAINRPPSAMLSASPISGERPLLVEFDGSIATDPDGAIESYAWDFGDGESGSGPLTSHTYGATGVYTATLTVTDDQAEADTAQVVITVLEPPNQPPVAMIAASPITGTAPLQVQFDAGGSTDSDGTITAYTWDWGDGNSSGASTDVTTNTDVTTSTDATASYTYTTHGLYTATVTVIDDEGEMAQASTTIDVAQFYLAGDLNCDGRQNAIDALLILQYDVELREASDLCPPPIDHLFLPACDVNGDNACTAVDALFVLQCDVNIRNSFCPSSSAEALKILALEESGEAIDVNHFTYRENSENSANDERLFFLPLVGRAP